MADCVEAGLVEELPPGIGTTITLAGKEVALFNVDGAIYAMDDSCLRHGVSLGTSNVEGKIVTCRGHGWKYDVTTGSTLNVPGYGVSSYAVRVEEGKIMVAIT
jgi:nitrite reductase/ring-hydroxylating ferredoxin subunit